MMNHMPLIGAGIAGGNVPDMQKRLNNAFYDGLSGHLDHFFRPMESELEFET